MDIFLVKNGYFDSRNKAQEAILRNEVYVNGKVINKFSYKIKENDKVKVRFKKYPRGYYKLQYIDDYFNLFDNVQKVLDLGSSAGGFALYCLERGNIDYFAGIEISKHFEKELEFVKIKFEDKGINCDIFFDDVFTFDINYFLKKAIKFDLLLVDLTLEPNISLQAVKRYLNVLNKKSKILWVYKGKNIGKVDFKLNYKKIELNLQDILKSKDREEFYLVFKL